MIKLLELYRTQYNYYICSLSFSICIFLLVPFELYYPSQADWYWNKNLPLSYVPLALGSSLAIFLVLYGLSKWHLGLAQWTGLILFYVGVYILLADTFSPLQTNVMDGSVLKSPEPWINTFIEAMLLLSIIIFACKSKLKNIDLSANISLALGLISLGYFLLILWTESPLDRPSTPSTQATATKDLPKNHFNRPNVYHIVLDELQTDIATIALYDLKLDEVFSGFTYFSKNLANFLSTKLSYASYMTSQFYSGGSFTQWYRKSHHETGLIKTLDDNGYELTTFGFLDYWNTSHINHFQHLSTFLQDKDQLLQTFYQL